MTDQNNYEYLTLIYLNIIDKSYFTHIFSIISKPTQSHKNIDRNNLLSTTRVSYISSC